MSYGDTVLEYALAANAAAEKIRHRRCSLRCPAVELRRVAEHAPRLILLAAYMDTLRPGRGMADILPEGLKAAGAHGVVVNHCEKPMSIPQIKKTIDRARELDFLVFACARHAGRGKGHRPAPSGYPQPRAERAHRRRLGRREQHGLCAGQRCRRSARLTPAILVEQAAGITNGEQVYRFLMAGSAAAGAASGHRQRARSDCND